jgi:NADH-quinone oxidoreductase subunit N
MYIFVISLISYGIYAYSLADTAQSIHALYNDSYVELGFHRFIKLLMYLGTASVLIMSSSYLRCNSIALYEYIALVIFALLGMVFLLSSSDFIMTYLAIELMSLSFYLLAAFDKNNQLSTEAGLKYFILGAFSSGLLLFGMSIIYGSTGSTSYIAIRDILLFSDFSQSEHILLGMSLVIIGLLFKLAAAPFHMWVPDVYQGSPTSSTAFFSIVPKVVILGVLFQVLYIVFWQYFDFWHNIILTSAILSMFIGSLGAINQVSIKRLFSYSAIGHAGYALMGFSTGSVDGVTSVLTYMLIYIVTLVGVFSIVLSLQKESDNTFTDKLSDLEGLGKTHPIQAGALTVLMFSIAGIPPLSGFFAKWYVFLSAVKSMYYFPVMLAILASVIGAFYYIRIIKIMYFGNEEGTIFKKADVGSVILLSMSILFTLTFFIYAESIITYLFKVSSLWLGSGF